ncbi:MAG: hypothetical protein PHW92_14300 [Lutibacter sp.]|nr:hypothetical protein [Lutibacter sp.]
MEKITTQQELKAAILLLEQKQLQEGNELKNQFRVAYNSVKPANIILNTLKNLGESSIVKEGILNTSVGFGTGYLTKMVFQGVVNSPLKKLFGSALMFGITNVVSKNPEVIKSLGRKFFNLFKNHSSDEVNESENEDIWDEYKE